MPRSAGAILRKFLERMLLEFKSRCSRISFCIPLRIAFSNLPWQTWRKNAVHDFLLSSIKPLLQTMEHNNNAKVSTQCNATLDVVNKCLHCSACKKQNLWLVPILPRKTRLCLRAFDIQHFVLTRFGTTIYWASCRGERLRIYFMSTLFAANLKESSMRIRQSRWLNIQHVVASR